MENMQLVALTPAELPATQAALADWCVGKMRTLGEEYRDMLANVATAKRMNWKRTHLVAAANRTKRRIQYYQKIRQAVRAGYLIVPNFPIEVMAVRVNSNAPVQKEGRWAQDVNTAQPELLPAGVGRYVDEITITRDASYWETKEGGKREKVERQRTGVYDDEVDFPVVAVKPMIMEATARAMALNLFDRIGIANHSGRTRSDGQRKADPIVLGQIVDPRYKGQWNERVVSFFVAWWLDTSVL